MHKWYSLLVPGWAQGLLPGIWRSLVSSYIISNNDYVHIIQVLLALQRRHSMNDSGKFETRSSMINAKIHASLSSFCSRDRHFVFLMWVPVILPHRVCSLNVQTKYDKPP
ncbi:hypothetical protein EDD22DRAFT_1049885 [Suillus occidentalis]|nr:hypothetical protein EDD22DRAFT_1049885 [Suillus occidentalis]